jgi:tRNA (guanine10-N2)-dimethyltransferase
MDSFFLLSGQNVDLGNGEVRALLHTYAPQVKVKNLHSRVIVAEVGMEKIMERAVSVKSAGKLLQIYENKFEFELDGIAKCRSFACELVNLYSNTDREILSDLGRYVKEQAPWMKVSLDNPDIVIQLIKTEKESVVGLVKKKERWKSGSVRNRPYFHPVALQPALCRIMINLAMVKENDTILDPYCGTGSIMLEAASMNIRALGSDLSERMCRGALKNSEGSSIVRSDALSLPFRLDAIDAVVTDLPYGRAASTLKRSPKELLKGFMDVLKVMRGRCCVMCRKGDEEEFANIVEQYDIYEHRNLTRKLMVVCN